MLSHTETKIQYNCVSTEPKKHYTKWEISANILLIVVPATTTNSYNDKLIPLPPELYLHHPSNIIQFS